MNIIKSDVVHRTTGSDSWIYHTVITLYLHPHLQRQLLGRLLKQQPICLCVYCSNYLYVTGHPYLFLYENRLGFSIRLDKMSRIENPVLASTWLRNIRTQYMVETSSSSCMTSCRCWCFTL